jgi:hypothetical protein
MKTSWSSIQQKRKFVYGFFRRTDGSSQRPSLRATGWGAASGIRNWLGGANEGADKPAVDLRANGFGIKAGGFRRVGGASDEEGIGLSHISSVVEIQKNVDPFLSSTFVAVPASYERGHPSSGNGFFFAFDRISAAWDNLSFWGYDEPSTDYPSRSVHKRCAHGCQRTNATRPFRRKEEPNSFRAAEFLR